MKIVTLIADALLYPDLMRYVEYYTGPYSHLNDVLGLLEGWERAQLHLQDTLNGAITRRVRYELNKCCNEDC